MQKFEASVGYLPADAVELIGDDHEFVWTGRLPVNGVYQRYIDVQEGESRNVLKEFRLRGSSIYVPVGTKIVLLSRGSARNKSLWGIV